MKTITAFVGSARKRGLTYTATRQFLDNLQSFGDVQCEIVFLSEYNLGVCHGCKSCFARGEECCPLKDDRDVLIEKMTISDGVVLASPVYSFQVSAIMKTFLDRLGFVFHRPRFHGKSFTSIVVQGIYGGGKVVKYLDFVGGGLGFNVVKGSCVTALEPMIEKEWRKMDAALARQSRRFRVQLLKPALPAPSLLQLMAFKMSCTTVKLMLGDDNRDYTYYRDHGWFESDYYYPTRLNPLKKAAGAGFAWMGAHIARQREARPAPRLAK
ncbi:MAG: flavodoxin family protein [Terracidiphilus sp.]|jgi:multimeric flavodoxin WrbA